MKYLRQRGPLSVASSLPSLQSLAPSQTQLVGIQVPFAQVNSVFGSHKRRPAKKNGYLTDVLRSTDEQEIKNRWSN